MGRTSWVVIALATLTAGCSHTEPAEPVYAESDFDVLARYITETNVFWDYTEYFEAMMLGTFEYDDVVRQPYVPAGPLEVSCESTHRLGAIVLMHAAVASSSGSRLAAEERGEIYSKRLVINHSWQHSGRSESDPRYDYRVQVGQYGVYSSGLTLTGKDRVNGDLTLTVSHKGKPLYETTFRLVDCPDST